MKKTVLTVTFLSAMGLVLPAYASGAGAHEHGHEKNKQEMGAHGHDSSAMAHDHDGPAMFMEKRSVDGYEVSFHIMQAKPGMEHGGSHNVMIKIEEAGKALQSVKINSKVVHPNGDAETKGLMKMGEWFMSGYDMGHAGKHQLMILFKTADGKKHKAGVYYTEQ